MELAKSITLLEIMLFLILGIFGLITVGIIIYFALRRKKNNPAQISGGNVANTNPRPQTTQRLTKRCPQCQSVYTDQSLQFCLTDGARLETSGNDEYETVVRNS